MLSQDQLHQKTRTNFRTGVPYRLDPTMKGGRVGAGVRGAAFHSPPPPR
jgi:hypothetical protein